MRLLVDTHLLLWAAFAGRRLPPRAVEQLEDARNELWFSSASIWEISIKSSLGRPDFSIDPRLLRSGLRSSGYRELAVSSDHAVAVAELAPLHGDPFDRMLIAQARAEAMTLLTHDAGLAEYGSPVRVV